MAGRIRKRTIFLKKATFKSEGQNTSIESYIRDAIQILEGNLPDQDKHHFFQKIHCSDFDISKKEGVYLYFTQTFEGSETSTVNKSNAGDRSVSTLKAPSGKDFLEHDLSVLIIENSVLTSSDGGGLSTTSLKFYLHDLFKRTCLDEKVGDFEITKVAHTNNIRRIEKIGVTRINLNVESYLATFEDMKGTTKGQILSHLFGKKNEGVEKNKENLRVQLHINAKGSIGQQAKDNVQYSLKDLAKLAVDDNDNSYKIILKDKSELSPNDLSVSKKVDLPVLGNSVDHKRIWQEMKRIYEEHKNDQSII